jgi:subtilase family serine protease
MGAVQRAAGTAGVTEVSMSWGGNEFSSEAVYDSAYFAPPSGRGVMFTASDGDSGNGAEWPAASPYVLSVGGTMNRSAAARQLGVTLSAVSRALKKGSPNVGAETRTTPRAVDARCGVD